MTRLALTKTEKEQILSGIEQDAGVTRTDARKIAQQSQRISAVIGAYAPQYKPFDYQTTYYDDYTTRFVIYKKSRQIGASHMAANKGIMRAMSIPRHQTLLLSLSLADAKEKIEYAWRLYEDIKNEVDAPPIDNKSRLEISLTNGSRLLCVYTPRGKEAGDLILDEYAHYQDPQKIWQATLPIMIHPRSRLVVMSTPLHSQTQFNDIWTGRDGKYTRFERREVRWWDCPVHCRDVAGARANILSPERDRLIGTEEAIEKYGSETIKEIYDTMTTDQFETEFELKEIDDDTALLPWKLIIQCTPTGEDAIEPCGSINEVAAKMQNRALFGGYDVGRFNDAGEMTLYAEKEGEEGVLEEVYMRQLHDTPFDIQENICNEAVSLPNMHRFTIDSTGMGGPIAENLERKWGSRVLKLNFSGPQQVSVATTTKMYMEKGRVTFIADRDRSAQMHSIKKNITEKGHRISYGAPKGKRHHGDAFWSRGCGIYGHADMVSLGQPKVWFL